MSAPQIESYHFGRIVVDGQIHTRDVIILPNGILGGWWRQEGHTLHPGDLAAVFDARPDVLVVGEGAYGRLQVAPEAEQALQAAGIQLVTQRTKDACQTYNELCTRQPVAAALHLTC
jgi:hypothetical protein